MELFNGSLLAILIAVAVFDFTNGFHDAADMVATAIASRAMTPAVAIGIVTFFYVYRPIYRGPRGGQYRRQVCRYQYGLRTDR